MERKKLVKTVRSAQNGDHKAVDALFNAYYNDVYYFALKTVKDEETACEVTQDTFVSILKNLKDLKEPAAFVTWMKQIAYNHCARFFQKKKEVLVDTDEEGNTVFDAVPEERTEFVPDEALDQEDFRKTILGMLDELSPEQRSATMLYYYSEMSVKQIAQIQGVSEGTVKSRLNYARKAIKKSVEDYEKKNDVKLHSVALLPLLFWMFAGAKAEMSAAAVPVMVGEISSATGIALTAGSTGSTAAGAAAASTGGLAAKLAGVPLATKIIAGVASISLTIGGIGAAIMHSNQKSPEVTDPICQHQWVDADCKVPKTCSLCGATEGGALGHTWIDANCEAPKTCSVCSQTEGEALGHSWTDASCEAPKTCTVCDKTDGEPLGHTWTDASCEAPKTCAVCGKTDGEALGHSWTDASYQSAPVCLICGTVAGDPLVPDFVTYDLNVITPQYGIEYEYKTACRDDISKKTVGKLYFSNYRTFEAEEGFEAEDGYEWHSVVAEIRFDDDNAWDYGLEVRTCFESYYDIVGWDESSHSAGEGRRGYSINYNGIQYTECIMTSSGAKLSGWQGKTNWYYCEFYWRVPVGYDGFVLGFRDAAVTWEDGQHIFDIADENTLLFRFEADGAMSNDPPKPTDYVPEGCTYVRPNGVTLQAGDPMPSVIYDGDEFITPDYTYKYGFNYGHNPYPIGGYQPDREFIFAGIDGWGVGVNDQAKATYSDILSNINGAPVTSLHGTFMYCEAMTKAPAIPNTVTDVDEAFDSCYSLTEAPKIPDGITSIYSTFAECFALVTVPELPDSIEDMSSAFSDCRSLAQAPAIPAGVKDLSGAFNGCELLTKAPVIPDGVKNLSSTFQCTSIITPPAIPSSVTDMDWTFSGCFSLVEAPEIPYGVKTMSQTFYGCTALVVAPKIPGSVTDLSGTFRGCTSLVTVPALPIGITNMDSTFYECTSLVDPPVIPAGVTNMDSTFYECTSLVDPPVIPASVISMDHTFFKCISLVNAPEIPMGVTNMRSTFSECICLEVAPNIPGSVTIMVRTFDSCYALTTPPVIGEGVQDMFGAFYNCDLHKAPNIPSTVTNLSYAFYGCALIESIPAIPEGVTDLSFAFSYCYSLKTVPSIPASVTDMSCAFRGCESLSGEIEINASITIDYEKCYLSICSYCFNGGYVCENCPNCSTIEQCFAGTVEPIILTGKCGYLEKMAATAENGNVTVE